MKKKSRSITYGSITASNFSLDMLNAESKNIKPGSVVTDNSTNLFKACEFHDESFFLDNVKLNYKCSNRKAKINNHTLMITPMNNLPNNNMLPAVSDNHVHRWQGKVNKAIAWLQENYSQDLAICDLAQKIGMSVSSFHHRFKATTSMTPIQYQKQLRLHEARRLMQEQRVNVSTASYLVGYKSLSQFSREYSKFFGLPPSQDIKSLRK